MAANHTTAPDGFRQLLFGNAIDRMLLLVVLAGIALAWITIRDSASGTLMVEIHHGKTLLATYPLRGTTPVHFEAVGDIGISEIVIDEHGARFASAPCNSQQCVLEGHKHDAGDIIACVPNRILLSIRGKQNDHKFDAVSQ